MDSNPEFIVKIIICVDCGEEFVFTASAQQYFAERGITGNPKRCRNCYRRREDGGLTVWEPKILPLSPRHDSDWRLFP